jgi:arginase family enzyme
MQWKAYWTLRSFRSSSEEIARDDDIVVFGYRNSAAQVRHRSQPLPFEFMAMDRDTIRRLGVKTAADEAVRWLSRPEGPTAYWIHVDVDVLDASIMSAVDDPQPDGLSWDELEVCLHAALVQGRSVGLQVCLYNPDMDPDGSSGRGLVRTLSEALALRLRKTIAAGHRRACGTEWMPTLFGAGATRLQSTYHAASRGDEGSSRSAL